MKVRQVSVEWNEITTTGLVIETGDRQLFVVETGGSIHTFPSIDFFCSWGRKKTGDLPAVGWGPRLLEE
jgi:hypothetical protein